MAYKISVSSFTWLTQFTKVAVYPNVQGTFRLTFRESDRHKEGPKKFLQKRDFLRDIVGA